MNTTEKLQWIIDNHHGDIYMAAEQALNYINAGDDEENIYINEDEKFGVTCALTHDEIMDPATWPDDWNYDGDTSDFTPLTEWVDDDFFKYDEK